jgi:hypothetical protein
MTILKAFPGATWVGSKQPGKPWNGTTNPMVVLHTLEFEGWPDPDRWDSPSHLVYNPLTRETRQYLPMDLAAYAVRDNALEDDEPTFQVELWGSASEVPLYSDGWYQGVAALCNTFVAEFDIPAVFADFSRVAVAYPGATPDRMMDFQVRAFTGFLGHCHMGLGTDTHWDPGRLDTDKVLSYMTTEEDDMATYEQFRADEYDQWTDTNIMDAYDAGMFEDTNRAGFHQYWVIDRDNRTPAEKARFMSDYYSHLWKRS